MDQIGAWDCSLQVMSTVVARICCFRSADVRGEFTQLNQSGTDSVRFDAHNELAPIVNHLADDENNQALSPPAEVSVRADVVCWKRCSISGEKDAAYAAYLAYRHRSITSWNC